MTSAIYYNHLKLSKCHGWVGIWMQNEMRKLIHFLLVGDQNNLCLGNIIKYYFHC